MNAQEVAEILATILAPDDCLVSRPRAGRVVKTAGTQFCEVFAQDIELDRTYVEVTAKVFLCASRVEGPPPPVPNLRVRIGGHETTIRDLVVANAEDLDFVAALLAFARSGEGACDLPAAGGACRLEVLR